jgi:hypothetical protein
MVIASMHAPFDRFAKQMVCTALETFGVVQTEAEVLLDTRRIDLWFMPAPARGSIPGHLGLLGRIADGPSTLEFFHDTPSGETLADCLIKHGAFRHLLSLRATQPAVPTQWIISSGRPDRGIDGLWLQRIAGSPPGLYEGPPLLWTRLVVVSELPVARDTLLVRLLGAGAVLKQAIAELRALQEEDPAKTLALPILVRLALEMPTDPTKQSKDDKEFLVETEDIVEAFRRESVQKGVVQGRAEGVVQGRAEGVVQGRAEGVARGRAEGVARGRAEGVARSLVKLYEARLGAMPEDLRAMVESVDDEQTLTTWLLLVGTHSANDVAAAIRSFRAS